MVLKGVCSVQSRQQESKEGFCNLKVYLPKKGGEWHNLHLLLHNSSDTGSMTSAPERLKQKTNNQNSAPQRSRLKTVPGNCLKGPHTFCLINYGFYMVLSTKSGNKEIG